MHCHWCTFHPFQVLFCFVTVSLPQSCFVFVNDINVFVLFFAAVDTDRTQPIPPYQRLPLTTSALHCTRIEKNSIFSVKQLTLKGELLSDFHQLEMSKSASKTQLLKQQQQLQKRLTPFPIAPSKRPQPTVPKGSHRAIDTNDYSVKFEHGPMYVRDDWNPMIHYRVPYSPALEVWLLTHCALNADSPPRYSAIRTTNHPTHRILGADVKSFHQLRDSGFRYQEKLFVNRQQFSE